jgi:hypothetical protein
MSVWNWITEHPWATAGVAVAAGVVVSMTSIAMATPRLDRDWTENLAVMSKVTIAGDNFSLDPVMDWSYTVEGHHRLDQLCRGILDVKNIGSWSSPSNQPYAAHTLLLFEFPTAGWSIDGRSPPGKE